MIGQEKLEIGGVLHKTFSVFFANFVPFTLLSAVTLSPIFVAQFVGSEAPPSAAILITLLVTLPLNVVLGQVVVGAITYGVFQQLRGHPAPLGECLRTGLRMVLRVIGVAILAGLATIGGTLLFIVPGIVIWIMLSVSVPAAVIERPGVREALGRSVDLTRGHRWQIFGVYIVLVAINLGLGILVGVLGIAAAEPRLQIAVQAVVTVFSTAVMSTAGALVYYRLRCIKEQFDVEQVAAVFA